MSVVINGTTGITDADGGTVLNTNDLASQAQAEAGTNNTTLMTPLRVQQAILADIASQAQAEAGTDNTALMTPLRNFQAVGQATAALSYGAVGTYAFLGSASTVAASTTLATPGATLAGSTLRAIGVYSFGTAGVQIDTTALSGTWRVMGFLRNISGSNAHQVGTVCLRIL